MLKDLMLDVLRSEVSKRHSRFSIAFPEGEEDRILDAVALMDRTVFKPVLIGNADKIAQRLEMRNVDLSTVEIQEPAATSLLIDFVVKKRKGKVDADGARELIGQPNYFATLLLDQDLVDGLVGGCVYATKDILIPAFQFIKTKPGVTAASGAFMMLKDEERLFFADCAVNIAPDEDALVGIGASTIETAKIFGVSPRVAVLSFSTNGSGPHELSEKMRAVTNRLRIMYPEYPIEGEIQFDAAYDAKVRHVKHPNSVLGAESANIFIFPDLHAGNIGYKIAQRMGGYEAIGPILQGLNKPVSDLSRGASAEDIVMTTVLTAIQACEVQ